MKIRTIIIGAIIVLIIGLILLITDLYWEWIPFLARGEKYLAKLGIILTAVSVLVAMLIGYIAAVSIEENKRLRRDAHRREEIDRKVRLLDEIIDWALEIRKRSLDSINLPSAIQILFVHGIPSTKNEYIRNIVSDNYTEYNLHDDIENIVRHFTGFLFFTMLACRIEPEEAKRSFNAKELDIVNELLREYASGGPDIVESVIMHRRRLGESISKLLSNISKAKIGLLQQ